MPTYNFKNNGHYNFVMPMPSGPVLIGPDWIPIDVGSINDYQLRILSRSLSFGYIECDDIMSFNAYSFSRIGTELGSGVSSGTGGSSGPHTHYSSDILDFALASQNAVGLILQETDTIRFIYNSTSHTISAEIKPDSLSSTQISSVSPTKIRSLNYQISEQTLFTTDINPTVLFSDLLIYDGVYQYELTVNAKRNSGDGTLGESASFKRTFRVKNFGGSISIKDIQSDYTSRDDPTWNIIFTHSSGNIEILAQGRDNTIIKWCGTLIKTYV